MPPPTASTNAISKKNWREERVMKDVPTPICEPLEKTKLWDKDGMPILNAMKEQFIKEGPLTIEDSLTLIQKASAVLKKEANLLHITDPVTVVGDIHGQFYDLMKLLEIGGSPKDGQYLFLGDYVDRGCFSCECALYMLALKIHYPKTVLMLRGNHECRHLTAYFNFKQECNHKYNLQFYDALMACFDCLPLAAILNGRFLCVHGGLSPDVNSIQDITNINRFREPPPSGAMTDILWSDPMDEEEEESTPDAMYLHNDLRGCSYVFSFKAACQFLKNNNLLSVIRAHEAQDEGYRLYKKNAATGFPTVICIFSAPNYCDTYNNKAAIIRFQNNLMNIRQFNSQPHPYYLPNFMNAFAWSMPFVAEKVTDMLVTIWQLVDDEQDENNNSSSPAATAAGGSTISVEREHQIRNKIMAMGKVSRMYKTLRLENENILKLKGLAGGSLPVGILQQGPAAIHEALGNFDGAKRIDKFNERRPVYEEALAVHGRS
jgi:serine/threonine-protein phosphatase 2B catalytic subunit